MSNSQSPRSTAEVAKDAVIDHVSEVAHTTRDAMSSGGWTYPLLGVLHCVTHPSLLRSVGPTLLKCIGTAVGVTGGLFIFTYLPQVAVCAVFSGPLAFLAAVPLVLGESYILTMFICKSFFLTEVQDHIFDAVLLQQGHEQLVSQGRQISSTSSGSKKLGRAIVQPFNRFTKEGIIRYLVSLPLNAIPVVGTVAFLLYNGKKAGPSYHERYFQLKQFDQQKKRAFIEKREAAYMAFGATALAVQLIPVVGLLFGFTSTVGAALWASQIEKKGKGDQNITPVPEENEIRVEL